MSGLNSHKIGETVFGRGAFARIGELAGSLGRAALIVYNGDEVGSGGALDRMTAAFAGRNIHPTLFRQRGEPAVDDVDRAVAMGRDANCDVAVGLGGGSAIDAAKAVAGLLANGGVALDYMEIVGKGQKITKPALPWIAVPTTAGTGSEATRNAVITFPPKRFKASIRSELLLPLIALIDPELGVTVPPGVTASSGMDALCQLIESYTSNGANATTDELALKGLALATRSLRRAYANGADLDAREDMARAANLSGTTLSAAGLGAVHGFAAPLGANFPAPHGSVCAVLLPHVIEANVRALRVQSSGHPTLARYARVGRILSGNDQLDDSQATARAITETAALVRDLRIQPLSAFGVKHDAIPEIVVLARQAGSMKYNPVTLSDDELAGILRNAL